MVFSRVIAVDDHNVGALERSAFEKAKTPVEPVETSEINTRDRVEKPRLLDQNAGGCDDTWLLLDKRQELRTECPRGADDGAAGRAYHNIRTDSARPPLLLLKHAGAQTLQCQHHGHLNGDRQNAE